MEQKMYYQNTKAFRHFITWRQRYRLGKYQYSIYSIVLIIIIIISYTSASINSEKLNLNNYNKELNNNNDNNNNSNKNNNNGNEHSRRHSHKYSQTIDSLLNSLKNSKNMIFNLDKETPSMPRLPYDNFDIGDSICPTCYFERNSDEIRLEAIKRQILSKLGLKHPPTITLPVPREVILETLTRAGDHPASLLKDELLHQQQKPPEHEEDSLDPEPDDFYGRTSEIITFAEPGQLLNGQTLVEFRHSSESDPGVLISQLRVKSAVLWVRVALNRSIVNHQVINKNMTLWVFRVKPSVANTSFLSGKMKFSFIRTMVACSLFICGLLEEGLRSCSRLASSTLKSVISSFLSTKLDRTHPVTTLPTRTEFDEHTELVGSLSVSLSSLGWQKIDMTTAVREWYREGMLHKEKLRLLVDCSGCKDVVQVLIFHRNKLSRNLSNRKVRSVETERTFDKSTNPSNKYKFQVRFTEEDFVKNISSQNDKLDPNRPFLVVHTEPVVMKRSRRRALDCSGALKGQCCKQNFFVSFKELKWDDWIIAPKGYHANYCRGDCGGIHRTPDTFLNYHTHVLEEYRKLDRLSGIQPCCAPVKFSSMSLIYFGPDNNIIKRDLPKMVVEQCGCP